MTEPSETAKSIGAGLGAGGGAVAGIVVTFLIYALFSSPCKCFVLDDCGDCLFGKTASEYWTSYGVGISISFLILGALIGGSI